jgi:hypothetical protein
MANIAYKTAHNDPNFPDGFITEHFETNENVLEGYTVVSLEVFNALFQNNIPLIRKFEAVNNVVTIHPDTPSPVLRPASDAEHVPANFVPPAPTTPDANSTELFNQFLAWVAAGKPNAPSNT